MNLEVIHSFDNLPKELYPEMLNYTAKVGKYLIKRFNEIKRKLFHAYYKKLNDKQREAVFSVNGPLLVLAGAGSGKTTVLVNRIAHIIDFGNAYNYYNYENKYSTTRIVIFQLNFPIIQ